MNPANLFTMKIDRLVSVWWSKWINQTYSSRRTIKDPDARIILNLEPTETIWTIYVMTSEYKCAFDLIFWRNLSWKLLFLCSDHSQLTGLWLHYHCVKSVQWRVFSGPYFPLFGLNKDIYGVNLRLQSKHLKIRKGKTPYLDTFKAMFCYHQLVFN